MDTTPKFQRTKEDFTCEQCGFFMVGTGYTNHCTTCLWSKHVDINPGDRKATCHGLMKPTQVTLKNGVYTVLHVCTRCGHERKNKVDEQDNFDALLKLASSPQEKIMGHS